FVFSCYCATLDLHSLPTRRSSDLSYKAAKAGDAEAAFTLIKDLALDFLLTIQNKVPHHCIFVSPYAQEATGDNAIPLILSLVCRSEEHTSELQSRFDLVCRLLLEK